MSTRRLDGATSLPAEALAEAVAGLYSQLARDLTCQEQFPLRIWNFVPDIQAPMSCGDRYMAFNAGRFAAYTRWFGDADRFSAAIPTASGVGVDGDALWVHVLSAPSPGTPIENPRQIPAYRYSRRYGQRPPCFARATEFDDQLLIGGTASIIGEDSLHDEDLGTQTHETLRNLAALIQSATRCPLDHALDRLIDVRVHVSDPAFATTVATILDEQIAADCRVEFVGAQLCRRELLVEIEGRAFGT